MDHITVLSPLLNTMRPYILEGTVSPEMDFIFGSVKLKISTLWVAATGIFNNFVEKIASTKAINNSESSRFSSVQFLLVERIQKAAG